MKYAVLTPLLRINRTSETEPQNVISENTVVQITDEQFQTIEAGRSSTPKVFYFLIDGELKTFAEKMELNRIANTPPELLALNALKAGMLDAWNQTFTAGEKAFLEPLYKAVLKKLDAGDLEGVKELIFTAPSISADLDAKRTALVNLLPAS